ncbi:MAG: hypothetical protein ACYTG0_07925 [Planctomycetota bacterium]|jgi:hypothetical protein
MRKVYWKMRDKTRLGTIVYAPEPTLAVEPRNANADPAFGDFNLPLPDQHAPGATGIPTASQTVAQRRANVETPANDRLRELAADNPPPPEWLEGDEEQLF